MRREGEVEVLEALRLPGTGVAWENPLTRYTLEERQVAIADELLSIARAVQEEAEPEYGAGEARLDQEMDLAMVESGHRDRQTIAFPLTAPTRHEEAWNARFREQYGCDVEDVEQVVDVFFPRV